MRNLPQRFTRPSRAVVVGLWGSVLSACVFVPPPPLPGEEAERDAAAEARAAAAESKLAATPSPQAGAGGAESTPEFAEGDEPALGMTDAEMRAYAIAQGDPHEGAFTLPEALDGVTGDGKLWAVLKMTRGDLECELFEKEAPKTVANFVGLARGKRATRDEQTGEWAPRPYYDGTEFHRVISGFMIQGGDPTGTGRGGTGYVIADEFVPGLSHDQAGRLSMANRGPGTGSGQFFITLGPTTHLDGKHTIFGQCSNEAIERAEAIAATAGATDRPTTPQVVLSVVIERRPAV